MPASTGPVDLARAPQPIRPLTAPTIVPTSTGEPHRTASLRVEEIVGGSGVTTVRWTLRSVTDQVAIWLVPLRPPLAASAQRHRRANTECAQRSTDRRRWVWSLPARWITGHHEGRSYLECLCSNLDTWVQGLCEAGAWAQLVTAYPALPKGVTRVDVILPGVAKLRSLPVSAASDDGTKDAPRCGPTSTPGSMTMRIRLTDGRVTSGRLLSLSPASCATTRRRSRSQHLPRNVYAHHPRHRPNFDSATLTLGNPSSTAPEPARSRIHHRARSLTTTVKLCGAAWSRGRGSA